MKALILAAGYATHLYPLTTSQRQTDAGTFIGPPENG